MPVLANTNSGASGGKLKLATNIDMVKPTPQIKLVAATWLNFTWGGKAPPANLTISQVTLKIPRVFPTINPKVMPMTMG